MTPASLENTAQQRQELSALESLMDKKDHT
jgi:hypothetical protein